jgi:hypothetical protein
MGIIYIKGRRKIKFNVDSAIPNRAAPAPKVFGKKCKNFLK